MAIFREAHARARELEHAMRDLRATRRDCNRKPVSFNEGECVLARRLVKDKHLSQKLICQWVEPMQVSRRLSPVSYELRRKDGSTYEAHVRDLIAAPHGTDRAADGMPIVTDYRRARPSNAPLLPLPAVGATTPSRIKELGTSLMQVWKGLRRPSSPPGVVS